MRNIKKFIIIILLLVITGCTRGEYCLRDIENVDFTGTDSQYNWEGQYKRSYLGDRFPLTDLIMGFYVTLFGDSVDGVPTADSVVVTAFAGLADDAGYKRTVFAVYTLCIVFYAISIITTIAQPSLYEIIKKVCLLSGIAYLIGNFDSFWFYVGDLFVGLAFELMGEFANIIVSSAGGGAPDCDGSGLSGAMLDRFGGFCALDNTLKSILSMRTMVVISAMFVRIADGGPLTSVLMLISFLIVGLACINISAVCCRQIVILGVLFILFPLYVLFLCFNYTKRYFQSWAANCAQCVITIAFAGAVLGMALLFFEPMFLTIGQINACPETFISVGGWDKTWRFDLNGDCMISKYDKNAAPPISMLFVFLLTIHAFICMEATEKAGQLARSLVGGTVGSGGTLIRTMFNASGSVAAGGAKFVAGRAAGVASMLKR